MTMTKLTREQVDEIRRLRNTTELSYRELAERYGVTKSNVMMILTNRTWKDTT